MFLARTHRAEAPEPAFSPVAAASSGDSGYETHSHRHCRVCFSSLRAGASAQSGRETLNLTLEDAVRRATENNPDLAIVRLDTQVEVERVSETLAAFVPVFSTVLGRSSSTAPPSNFLLGERGVDTRDWFSSTGVRQRLAQGLGHVECLVGRVPYGDRTAR